MNRYNRSDKPDWVPPRSAKLLDQVRERVRYLHYSLQTEKAYVYWAKAFVLWAARSGGGFRHPREMGQADVEGFLTMLATEKQVSPAAHRQALNALLFLYRQVLGMELPWLQQIGRHAIVVRSGKGDKDRVVMLPKRLFPQLKSQLAHA